MLSFVAMAEKPLPWPAPRAAVRLLLAPCAGSRNVSRQHLVARGYDLVEAATFDDAAPLLASGSIDLVIVDAGSSASGLLDRCRALAQGDCRLIVIYPIAEPALAIEALEAGADDCLPSKHNARELVARVRAVLRGRKKAPVHECGRFLSFGDLSLDVVRHELHDGRGARAALTPHQFKLFKALLARPGEVVPRQELFDLVHGEESDSFDRAVDVHVSRLRKRLMELTGEDLITAYRGVGYRLTVLTRP